MKEKTKSNAINLVYSAVCLALCLVLPFFTGQIPQLGSALCPMHFPVFIAGFLCGPWWAMVVGLIAPLLRSGMFGMPPMLTAIAMAAELAAYGFISGVMYRTLRKSTKNIYFSLITAMVGGRIVWGVVKVLLTGLSEESFTWALFMSGAVVGAVPGIVLQILIIPIIVIALRRSGVIYK